jgi:hypothetical protein
MKKKENEKIIVLVFAIQWHVEYGWKLLCGLRGRKLDRKIFAEGLSSFWGGNKSELLLK